MEKINTMLIRLSFLACFLSTIHLQTKAQVILTESFDNPTFPPVGWHRINLRTNGEEWQRITNTTNTGAGAARVLYGSNDDNDAWLFTSGVALTAGNNYEIKYYQRTQPGQGHSVRYSVRVGLAQTVASQSVSLARFTNLNNGFYTLRSHAFTPTASGVYFFGFNCDTYEYYGSLLIDDVEIVQLGNPLGIENHGHKNFTIKVWPNPTSDQVFWRNETQNRITKYEIRNIFGQLVQVYKYLTLVESATIDLINLPNGIYFLNLTDSELHTYSSKIVKQK